MNWSIEASRNAIAADVDLLLPHLDNPDPDVRAWTRALWTEPAQAAEVRVSAALAWLCLVEDFRATACDQF